MRKLLPLILGLCFFSKSHGQDNKDQKKSPTIVLSGAAYDFLTADRIRTNSFSSVISNKQWADFNEMDFAVGLSFINGINNNLDYSINLFTGNAKYPIPDRTDNSKESFLTEVDASIHMKLLTDKHFLVPYLSAGIGGSLWNQRFEAFIPTGAGLQFKLAPASFIFSNIQYRIPVTQGANYHFLYSLGFGGGITNQKEPEVKAAPPAPVVVPEAPKDTDGDGINDNVDKCPTVAGVAKYEGCPVPDTDADGIKDDVDKCPTVAGVAKYEGCPVPDTDGDGIKDDADSCVTVAGIAKYNGCPIPDTDGDGFNDEEDKCPTVAGIKELYGCPRPDFKAENVLFATGSANLVAAGKKELDIIADYLKTYTGFNVLVKGHTDNTGDEKANQTLSEKRAESAKKYLVSQGVEASRLSTVGFGESQPWADNKTSDGRKKNRRVQFEIVQ